MALDADGYPLEESLKAIEKFDLLEGLKGSDLIPGRSYNENLYRLLSLVRESMKWANSTTVSSFRVRKSGRLYLITGGWSGNEDVIDALGKCFLFWSQHWERSLRGGHFTFEIPRGVAKRLLETA